MILSWWKACNTTFSSVEALCDPMDYGPPRLLRPLDFLGKNTSELPCPPQGPFQTHPGIEPTSLLSLALAGGFFSTRATWEAHYDECICPNHRILTPQLNSWLWCINICSSIVTEIPLWREMLITGDYTWVGTEGTGGILCISPQYCCEPKTTHTPKKV